MQAFQDALTRVVLGNTLQAYLISAAVFLGVFVGLPIVKAIVLRHLKTIAKKTTVRL